MEHIQGFDKCKSYINCHLSRVQAGDNQRTAPKAGPVITISRQEGTAGPAAGMHLIKYLQAHDPTSPLPWTLFDKNLVSQVLTDHQLSQDLAKFMNEERSSAVEDAIEEFLGLHPSEWAMFEKTSESILRLAHTGNVVIVGRGANLIIGSWAKAFHVRLIGSEAVRVRRVQEIQHVTEEEARVVVRRTDRARKSLVRRHFSRDIDDPKLYHLVLNTDLMGLELAATIVGQAALQYLGYGESARAPETIPSEPAPASREVQVA